MEQQSLEKFIINFKRSSISRYIIENEIQCLTINYNKTDNNVVINSLKEGNKLDVEYKVPKKRK